METICTLAAPLKSGVAVKLMPSSAALIAASVPSKVMIASAVPSPAEKLRPVIWLSVSVPLVE